jgi:hypothetical protein
MRLVARCRCRLEFSHSLTAGGNARPMITFPSTAGSYTLLFDDDGSATPGHVLA